MNDFFRQEAIDNQRQRLVGSMTLITAPSTRWLTFFFAIIGILFISFLFGIKTSSRAPAIGQLIPEYGLIKLTSPKSATVYSVLVNEGDLVEEGRPLLLLRSTRSTQSFGNTGIAISEKIIDRKQSLVKSLHDLEELKKQKNNAILQRQVDINIEKELLHDELRLQNTRTTLAKESLNNAKKLLRNKYISKTDVKNLKINLLRQQSNEKKLKRLIANITKENNSLTSDLSQLPLQSNATKAEINRQISALEQESIEHSTQQEILVTAPQAGKVSAVLTHIGQSVSQNTLLIQLSPKDSILQAKLYATSRAIGFIRPGQLVKLRYHAFPYQKFGHQDGYVTGVSHTAIQPADLENPPVNIFEPVYQITVALHSQTITAYGHEQILQPGIQVDADILLDTRRVIEWIFEPLIALTGHI